MLVREASDVIPECTGFVVWVCLRAILTHTREEAL
jgi:hypothetical protein